MLEQQTLQKLNQLKLSGMLEAIETLQHNNSLCQLSLQEGLGILVDYEYNHRSNKRLERLLKSANLRYKNAMIEDINYQYNRGIAVEKLRLLASGTWLINHKNILFIGPSGIGKTYLACALAKLACQKAYPTKYFRLSKLLEMMRIAKADGSFLKFTASLHKMQCLIIDDWGIDPIPPERRADLLEIIDDQYEQRSIIIAAQIPVEHWHDYIGDHTIADAILDRVIHNAIKFNLTGESMRKNNAS